MCCYLDNYKISLISLLEVVGCSQENWCVCCIQSRCEWLVVLKNIGVFATSCHGVNGQLFSRA